MRIVWLPEARDDVQRLFDFLVDKDPRAAERAIEVIQLGLRKLSEFPHVGSPMDEEMERRQLFVPFGNSAYVIRYVIIERNVVVIRVWHAREDR